MNAVIYARYSSHGQRDVSIEDQVREITDYAQFHNYNVIRIYADRKRTGKETEKRKDFLRMIHDSAKHEFQCVLVYKHDRFARNKYDSVIYKKKLKDNGVKVVAVAEPIPDGAGAKILESIYEAMAEEYSENLSQNIKRGQKGNALKGLANHKAPFGYIIDKKTHKYVIDEENAPYIRSAYAMILQGKQNKDVLEYLKLHNKPHSKNWLYQALHNERYTGVYIYGDTRIEYGMPQLVSKDDYTKVQEIMKKRQQKPQLKPYHYLFSGLIYCGYCGSLMNGESTMKPNATYRYYICPKAKKQKRCHKQRIPAESFETKIIEALKSVIFTDEVIDRLATDVYNYLTRNQKESITELTKRLNAVEKSLANILFVIESTPNAPATLVDRMADLEKQKEDLSNRISNEQFSLDTNEIQKEDLINLIRNFDQLDNQALVNTFVTRLVVYDDHAILTYDASGDNEIHIPLNSVLDTTLLHQSKRGTNFIIKNAKLYIFIEFAA